MHRKNSVDALHHTCEDEKLENKEVKDAILDGNQGPEDAIPGRNRQQEERREKESGLPHPPRPFAARLHPPPPQAERLA